LKGGKKGGNLGRGEQEKSGILEVILAASLRDNSPFFLGGERGIRKLTVFSR
jgi:hypothetical protein